MLRSPRATLVYYGTCVAVAIALATVHRGMRDTPEAVIGLALLVAVAGVRVLFLRSQRNPAGPSGTLELSAYVLFFVGFAVLRDAAGASAPLLVPIILLPVVAAALHGGLAKLAVVVGAVFAVMACPALVVFGSDAVIGPDAGSTLRAAGVWTVLAGCLGLLVHGLVAGLAERDREQRALLAVVDHCGIITTDAVGRILALNDGARTMLGLSPGQSLAPGTTMAALETGDRAATREVLDEALACGSARREREWTNTAGVTLTLDTTTAPGRDPQGRLTGWTVLLLDVTAAAQARAVAARSELRWRTLVENLPETSVLVADENLRHQVTTGAGLARMGLAGARGATVAEVFGETAAAQLEPAYRQALAGSTSRTEFALQTPTGTMAVAVVATPLPAPERVPAATDLSGGTGGSREVLVLAFDVSEQRRHEEALTFLADHDPLTGLANRRRFDADLAAHLEQCRRGGSRGAVLTLDLDQFKAINDTLGHAVGDRVIVATAELLRARLRAEDVVARLGGDEFAILLADVDPGEAATVAADLVEAFRSHPFAVDGSAPRRNTVSIGVVPVVRSGDTAAELMATADLTMYDAKESGRDTYVVCDLSVGARTGMASRLDWAERINSALAHDGFVFHAQPVRSLHSGRVESAELLLRMVDDTGELVAPGRFLHVAERVGLIAEIDALAVDRAVEILARVQSERPEFTLAVNISGQSVGNPALVERIAAGLRRTGARGSGLVLEITETVAIPDFAAARTFLDDLRTLGIRFALDDFGAGFGSLAYLKRLDFDYLKIDGDFVAGCVTDAGDRLIIDAIVALARGLGIETVAEFVTDSAVLEVVRRHGVDHAQGYGIGKPVPVEVLLRTLAVADADPTTAVPMTGDPIDGPIDAALVAVGGSGPGRRLDVA